MAVRGRYEVLRRIASGGMATVHLGRAVGVGGFERFVAIKVMHAHLADEPEFVAMFLDEARLAARIRHPNVVGTLDIQQDDQGLFLVMDYVEGPALQRIIRALGKQKRGPAPLDVALRVFLDALAGLHAAHELRGANGEPLHLVHRDVSPQNILVGFDGIAQITDFGVARAESRLHTTRDGAVKGKVRYMAPEQIRSEPIDRRTDVYAAGALLWELTTGERLVLGDNDSAMMASVLAGQFRSPHEVNPSVPEAIAAVSMQALAASPEDRPPTAAAFAESLEAAAAGAGVSIATPRGVAAFIKGLGLEPGDGLTSVTSSPSVDAPAPTPAPRADDVAATTGPRPSGAGAESTDAAMLAPPAPRKGMSGPVAAGVVVVVVLFGLALAKGPLRLSWREDPVATGALALGSQPPPASAAAPPVEIRPAVVTAAPSGASSAAPPPAASAPRPASAPSAPRAPRPKPEGNPASFRPKDL